jgi:hypothetical protein
MKYVFIVLLIFFFCNANLKANSTSNFKEGYIISLKGDTIKGFLLEQIGRNASKQCVFKPNANSESKMYKPDEIAGYRYLNGKYYISKEVSIDSTTKKVVFLEFLIKGMVNVYYNVDNEEHYYIEKYPNDLLELTEKQTTYYNGGHNYISQSKYKGKLIFELNDCPGINKEIQNTRLTHKSLIKLTKDYHEKVCKSANCIIYESRNNSTKVKFGILIGFSQNKYNFDNLLISNFNNSFQIGAGIKVSNFLFSNKHFSLNANFLFEKDSRTYLLNVQDFSSYYSLVHNNTINYLGDFKKNGVQADLSIIDLKIPISLNYNFNIAQKTIYNIGVGISNKRILSQKIDYQLMDLVKSYKLSVTPLIGGMFTTGIEGNWLGKHSVFLNATYEYLFSYKSENYLSIHNNQLSIQAGIYF